MDIVKTTEALLYICPNLKVKGYYQMMKVLYFADKYHLSHFGRTISKDTYYKLEDGPVPTITYKKIKDRTLIDGNFITESFICTPIREPNMDHLSESDIEALDYAISKYSQKSYGELRKLSHDASWEAAPDFGKIDFDAFILTFDEETQEELKAYVSAE